MLDAVQLESWSIKLQAHILVLTTLELYMNISNFYIFNNLLFKHLVKSRAESSTNKKSGQAE